MARAKQIIGGMTKEIEVGQTYHGRVVSIKEFGAFVEVLPGKDGLVHISELADFRVNRTEDVAKIGDMIWVKCIGIDDKGRVKLSRKAAMKERGEIETGAPVSGDVERADGGERHADRGDGVIEATGVIEAIAGIGVGDAAAAAANGEVTKFARWASQGPSRNHTPKITSLRASRPSPNNNNFRSLASPRCGIDESCQDGFLAVVRSA